MKSKYLLLQLFRCHWLCTSCSLIICMPSIVFGQNDTTIFVDVTATHLPSMSSLSNSSAVGDLDNDGDLDIVLGPGSFGPGWSGQTRLYINAGDGYYTEESSARLPTDAEETNDVILGDIDSDGDLDLFIANIPQGTLGGAQDNLYLNLGDGYFMDVTERLPQAEVHSAAGSFVDVNGDNTLDLIVAHIPPQILLNDGTGHFADCSATHVPVGVDTLNIFTIIPTDIDGDWDLDLIVLNALNPLNFYDQHEEVWINSGEGIFTRHTEFFQSAPDDPGLDGDVYDLNGDGIHDIVVAQVFENELYLSTGVGQYENVSSTHLPENFRNAAIQFGDVNGNGLVDLVLANGMSPDQLFINTGSGMFIDSTEQYLPEIPQSSSRDVNLFDADNDADLDLHFASTGDGQNRLLINTGSAQDMTPPALRHDEEAATWQDTSQRGHLRVFASDASRWITEVSLIRHPGFRTDTIEALSVGGDLYQATIDSQLAATSWAYHWTAVDRAGNQSRLPTEEDEFYTWVPQPVSSIINRPSNDFDLDLSVYPNPFNSQLHVSIDPPRGGSVTHLTVTLRNLRGQEVYHNQINSLQSGMINLSLKPGQVATGIYFLTVSGSRESRVMYQSTQKIILLK